MQINFKWQVCVLHTGTANGFVYGAAAVKDIVRHLHFFPLRIFRLNGRSGTATHAQSDRKEIWNAASNVCGYGERGRLGYVDTPEGRRLGALADVTFFPSAAEIVADLSFAFRFCQKPLYGLSVVVDPAKKRGDEILKIGTLISVDLVSVPALSGARFLKPQD